MFTFASVECRDKRRRYVQLNTGVLGASWRLIMLKCVKAIVLLVSVLVFPASAYAQASIVGTARDASGAILPGVAVEASSPALIEKARSVVTNGVGQYAIEDLRPG